MLLLFRVKLLPAFCVQGLLDSQVTAISDDVMKIELDVEMIVARLGLCTTGKEVVRGFTNGLRASNQLLMTMQTSCLDNLCRCLG